ncbi:MAG TPA: sulfite exporter TauE/SafE family protein [Acetobacteraceae bacterium]|nr:sulfite exporter TauE/SafE family protein [Acetobacteraceae bacterium]
MLVPLLMAMFGVFAASVLRGFTGFGFGLSAVPLLSLVLPPHKVVPFVTLLQVLVGLPGLRSAWRIADLRAVLGLGPGLVLGVPIGLVVLIEVPPNGVRLAIGLLIMLSVVGLWRRVRLPPHPSRGVTLAAGLVSGVMNGLGSMGGAPVVVYLLALSHEAAVVRASSIVYFLFAAIVTAIPMAARGLVDREVLLWSAAAIPVLLVGSAVGNWAFGRAGPGYHRLTALVVLSVLAAALIGRSLAG